MKQLRKTLHSRIVLAIVFFLLGTVGPFQIASASAASEPGTSAPVSSRDRADWFSTLAQQQEGQKAACCKCCQGLACVAKEQNKCGGEMECKGPAPCP